MAISLCRSVSEHARRPVALWFPLDPLDVAVYLPRAAAFDPDIFKLSELVSKMQRKVRVTALTDMHVALEWPA